MIENMLKNGGGTKGAAGLVLTELLVIVAILALLAAILLPTLRGARARAQGDQCLNNERLLMLAALQYADDNSGLWLPNQPYGTPAPGSPANNEDWATDPMDWGSLEYGGGYSATNWQLLLTGPHSPLAQESGCYALFAPYIRDARAYKCPSDPSMVQGVGPRVRSYSGNMAVGTCWVAQPGFNTTSGGPVTGQWLSGSLNDAQTYGFTYQKISQMIHPSPVKLFIFCDEHPDSINDSTLAVQIANTGLGGDFIDCPGNLHAGAGSFSFADGHAQMHRWQGRILGKAPFINGPLGASGGYSFGEAFPTTTASTLGDLQDLNWLQSHTSYPRNRVVANTFPEPTDP